MNALVSPVTLKAFLEDDEGLRELGGPVYLTRLAGSAISSLAARGYARMIHDLSIRRDLIQLGAEIWDRAARVEVTGDPKEQIVEAEQALYSLGERGRLDGSSRPSPGRSPTPSGSRTPPSGVKGASPDWARISPTLTESSGVCTVPIS